MQCNYNSFIQIINFHGLFRNALRCRKTGACRILVPLRYLWRCDECILGCIQALPENMLFSCRTAPEGCLNAPTCKANCIRAKPVWKCATVPRPLPRKTLCLSRGAYGHNPFWSVFEEHPLDSTRSGRTMTLSININSAIVISVVVESSRCSSKTLQKGSCPYAPLDEALRYGVWSRACQSEPYCTMLGAWMQFRTVPHWYAMCGTGWKHTKWVPRSRDATFQEISWNQEIWNRKKELQEKWNSVSR